MEVSMLSEIAPAGSSNGISQGMQAIQVSLLWVALESRYQHQKNLYRYREI